MLCRCAVNLPGVPACRCDGFTWGGSQPRMLKIASHSYRPDQDWIRVCSCCCCCCTWGGLAIGALKQSSRLKRHELLVSQCWKCEETMCKCLSCTTGLLHHSRTVHGGILRSCTCVNITAHTSWATRVSSRPNPPVSAGAPLQSAPHTASFDRLFAIQRLTRYQPVLGRPASFGTHRPPASRASGGIAVSS